MNNFLNIMDMVWETYILSDEGLATLLIIFVIVLKLLINQRITILHLKKTIITIPSEITFLVVGFLLSSLITKYYKKDIRALIAMIMAALIGLIIQYALERVLDDKLSGKWKCTTWFGVIFMYFISIVLYIIIVFGGII